MMLFILGEQLELQWRHLVFGGGQKKINLLAMIDRGHRELPIQPDFCGKQVLTNKDQNIELRLKSLDKIEGVFLV